MQWMMLIETTQYEGKGDPYTVKSWVPFNAQDLRSACKWSEDYVRNVYTHKSERPNKIQIVQVLDGAKLKLDALYELMEKDRISADMALAEEEARKEYERLKRKFEKPADPT